MLGLAASHLNFATNSANPILHQQAIMHRVEAVRLLKNTLTTPAKTKEDADARFATFMVLTFQSTCMVDGMIEFLTMIRGCFLHGQLSDDSAFSSFMRNRHLETMDALTDDLHNYKSNSKLLNEAKSSIDMLRPLCHHAVEFQIINLLTKTLESLKFPTLEGK